MAWRGIELPLPLGCSGEPGTDRLRRPVLVPEPRLEAAGSAATAQPLAVVALDVTGATGPLEKRNLVGRGDGCAAGPRLDLEDRLVYLAVHRAISLDVDAVFAVDELVIPFVEPLTGLDSASPVLASAVHHPALGDRRCLARACRRDRGRCSRRQHGAAKDGRERAGRDDPPPRPLITCEHISHKRSPFVCCHQETP